MLVEDGSGQCGEKRSVLPPKADLALRQAFVQALSRGDKSSAIAEELGIGLSTVYKWRRCWAGDGESWLAGKQRTKAKRLPGHSETQSELVVVALSLENPKWGAARLARELTGRYNYFYSTGAVHSILARHGVSTRMARAQKLYEKYVGMRGDRVYAFNEEQRELLSLISPFAAWPRGQAGAPGFRLVQQLVSIGHASPIGNALLMVIVDAGDQRAFARFNDLACDSPEGEFLREVLGWYENRGMAVKEVVTNHGYQYLDSPYGSSYKAVLKEFDVSHRLDTFQSGALRLNPLVKDVWSDLRNYLFKKRRLDALAARDSHSALNQIIQEFLDKRFGDV